MTTRGHLAIAAALVLLTACSADADPPRAAEATATAPDASPSAGPTTESPYQGPTIPDGVYSKEITKRDVRVLGIDPAQVDSAFSSQETVLVVYKFASPSWAQFEGATEEQLSSGSHGTLRYEKGRRLVLSEDCCGDSVLSWRWDGTRLTLRVRSGEVDLVPMDHLMRDGVYAKVG